jgi:hypothetical protein
MARLLMTGTPGGRFMGNTALPGRTRMFEMVVEAQAQRQTMVHPIPPLADGQVLTDDQADVAWVVDLFSTHRTAWFFRGHPNQSPRFAVYHPRTRVGSTIASFLTRSGLLATRVNADAPAIPDRGVVVGTWVIVTGVNITPPPQAMVDLGWDVVQRPRWTDVDATHPDSRNRFRNSTVAYDQVRSSPSNSAQVAARTGRTEPGMAISHPRSGTGVEAPHRPNVLAWVEAYASAVIHPVPDGGFGMVEWLEMCSGFRLLVDRRPDLRTGTIFDFFHQVGFAVLDGMHLWVQVTLALACECGDLRMAINTVLHLRPDQGAPNPELVSPEATQNSALRLVALARSLPDGHMMGLLPPATINDFVGSWSFRVTENGVRRYFPAQPLVAYRTVIAPCGMFASTDPGS